MAKCLTQQECVEIGGGYATASEPNRCVPYNQARFYGVRGDWVTGGTNKIIKQAQKNPITGSFDTDQTLKVDVSGPILENYSRVAYSVGYTRTENTIELVGGSFEGSMYRDRWTILYKETFYYSLYFYVDNPESYNLGGTCYVDFGIAQNRIVDEDVTIGSDYILIGFTARQPATVDILSDIKLLQFTVQSY